MEQITATNQSQERWIPVLGEETQSLLEFKKAVLSTEKSRIKLVDETVEILSQCGDPRRILNNDIGLVFGYVQSGKTMSFTTLTALAKDNGYKIIIIIAGISTNLVSQSFTRIEKDLQIDSRNDQQWLSFRNPRLTDITTRNVIATALEEWNDKTVQKEDLKTILITVMKQRNHLPNLQELLQTLDLSNTPTLIIDDEGDQHSMNTMNRQNSRTGQNRMSRIHESIVNLKNSIPHHTFIQYTATPQAPLFQSLMDNLSPKFIQLLTPGEGYTGGRTFFIDRPELSTVIPDIDPEEGPTTPPQSLIYAMQIFFLGVVKGKPKKDGNNRSMMIHPSQLTYTHSDYYRFVNSIKKNFVEILGLENGNQDKVDLLLEFKEAYLDLASTTNDLPPFEEMVSDKLRHSINSTVIQSLNSRSGNKTIVDWRNSYSWILIGGQAMDRGFTVEGLTVTYMPRTIGVGNADTIQQRARFFGYKSSYLGYCRIYLDREARDSYINYVEHEEDMRRRLAKNKESGKSLNEWYREVYLALDLNISRPNIFSEEFERTVFGGEWSSIKIPHYSKHSISNNQSIVDSFIKEFRFSNNKIPSLVANLDTVYDELLTQLRFPSSFDAGDYTSLLYLLERLIEENQDEQCTIYLMSDFEDPRERSLTSRNFVNQIFQGSSSNYKGDRSILGEGITFQIHILNLLTDGIETHSKVPVIATYIPEEMGKEFIRWRI